ncbi:LysR family transcriptional regulator [Yinghuangia seranimata]|uniref:LysR family transcriptional regulator n=1 Tax=Yinghuangia seranimata TaxID=408067 RepID=UPI00248B8EAD|nr:LysR family transcriptional regulator [Yinghuangia seranimata]MDI2131118.1 LysR family transcriptional regulator [Yinghuangia seranimata]
MLERAEIEIFLTLADELHFGRTAARLHVSPPLVTQTIQKTERRLGVTLFTRSSRRVELTDVGRALREDLLPLYEGIRRALDRAELAGLGMTGVLSIGFMGHQAGRFVSAAREIFELRNPTCGLRVVETHLHQHVSQLRDGSVDVVLMALPVDEPDMTVGRLVTRGERYMCVAADHRLTRLDSVSFEDLAGETFAAPRGAVPAYFSDFHMPRWTPSGRPIMRSAEVCDTYYEALALVSSGRAIIPGDAQLLYLYQRPDIAFIKVPDMPPIEHGLIWRKADDGDQRVRAFADIVMEIAPETSAPGTVAKPAPLWPPAHAEPAGGPAADA